MPVDKPCCPGCGWEVCECDVPPTLREEAPPNVALMAEVRKFKEKIDALEKNRTSESQETGMKQHEYRLYYLASPYSHDDPEIRQDRYEKVNDATILLLKQKVYAFSPITYNHPMERHQLPTNWEFWMPYDIAFLERCDELLVLKLDGWHRSVGVAEEIEKAIKLKIPVRYLDPKDVFADGYVFEHLVDEL